MRINKYLIVMFLVLLLNSCGQRRVVLLGDPWLANAFGYEKTFPYLLPYWSILKGKIGSYEKFENGDSLINYLNLKDNGTYLVTAYYSPFIQELVDQEDEKKYIILNEFYRGSADNIIAVYSFRENAYFQAGQKSAQFLDGKEDSTISAVFYTATEERQKEMDAFVEGFLQFASEESLSIYELANLENESGLEKFIGDADLRNSSLFFFSVSSLNPLCLDLSASFAHAVGGENMGALIGFEPLLKFSIDDDLEIMIKTALELKFDGDLIKNLPIESLFREEGIDF